MNLIIYDNDVGGGWTDSQLLAVLAGHAGHGDELLPLGPGVLPEHGPSGGESDDGGGQRISSLSLSVVHSRSFLRAEWRGATGATRERRRSTEPAPGRRRRTRRRRVLPRS